MTDQDNSYRPRSPDFSAFQTPISPSVNHPVYPFGNPLAHRASYDASPFFTPQYQQPPAPPSRVPQQYIYPFADAAHLYTDMARRSTRLAQAAEAAPPPQSKYIDPVVSEDEEPARPPSPSPPPPPPPPAPAAVPVEVKTKFPVARIKRIMQADEDVGKVAQVTPIAVSKALELFMISLVTKAAKEAKDRNSKRVTASHLKQAVAKDEVLDFLADIIAKVPDQPASRKHDDDGSDQNEQPKRKRGGRRPKDDSD
ncbi:negative cofactor 2 transcription regulator complex subunit BUR6 [Aspergillus homomorphus CBS 101889]|uniref:NCT transcriptional regulatory complex subunit A n=1 Tax=Aspergillus homomorphus (strain CBS 101889) TaxID=1450537 RepID=A0A395I2H1_ASPHC|nr:putative CBF/NF-Y family transcription factor [Aspergillus homomorphus CBS 101889]RAL13863.1 putative CBF/NF-Y family transcription factor [Aspergillus homomorphus CBS 101889]